MIESGAIPAFSSTGWLGVIIVISNWLLAETQTKQTLWPHDTARVATKPPTNGSRKTTSGISCALAQRAAHRNVVLSLEPNAHQSAVKANHSKRDCDGHLNGCLGGSTGQQQ